MLNRIFKNGTVFWRWNCILMLNWIVWNWAVCMYKNGLGINNLQWLICHKTKPNQSKLKWFYYIDALEVRKKVTSYRMPPKSLIIFYKIKFCEAENGGHLFDIIYYTVVQSNFQEWKWIYFKEQFLYLF